LTEKRMLIIPAELAQKIDENRGDLNESDFIEFLIESRLKTGSKEKQAGVQYATKEEVRAVEEDLKKLLKSFLDFFLNYGLEIGNQPKNAEFKDLTDKLKSLDKESEPENEKGRATIKWK
jgi:hypothetical protein